MRYWLSKPICILELENCCLHQTLSQCKGTTSSAPGSHFSVNKTTGFVPPAACDNQHHLLKRGAPRPISLPHVTDQACWPCSAGATDANSLGRRIPCHPAGSNLPHCDALSMYQALWSLPACRLWLSSLGLLVYNIQCNILNLLLCPFLIRQTTYYHSKQTSQP